MKEEVKKIRVEMSASDEVGTNVFEGKGVLAFVFNDEGLHLIANGAINYLDMAMAMHEDREEMFDKMMRAMNMVNAEINKEDIFAQLIRRGIDGLLDEAKKEGRVVDIEDMMKTGGNGGVKQ